MTTARRTPMNRSLIGTLCLGLWGTTATLLSLAAPATGDEPRPEQVRAQLSQSLVGDVFDRSRYLPEPIAANSDSSQDECNIVISTRENRPHLVLHSGGPQSTVRSIEFSPDSDRMYTGGLDKAVSVWGFQVAERGVIRAGRARGLLVQTLRWEIDRGPNGQIFALAASPTGRQLAIAGFNARVTDLNEGGDVIVYDTARAEVERVLHGHTAPVVSIAYSPAGKSILSAARNGQVIVWKEEKQWQPEAVHEAGDDVGVFVPVAFLDETHGLFPVRGEKKEEWKLALADTSQPKEKVTVLPTSHSYALTSIAVDRARQRFATSDLTGDGKGRVYVWTGGTSPTSRPLRAGRLALAMDFDPTGRLFVASALFPSSDGSRQSVLEMWDVDASKMVDQVEISPQENGTAVRVSPDGSRVATFASHSSEVRLYSLKERDGQLIEKPLQRPPLRLKGHGQNIAKVSFEKDAPADKYRLGYGTTLAPKSSLNDLGPVTDGFDLSEMRPMEKPVVQKTAWRTPTEGVKGWSAEIDARGSKLTIKNGGEKWTEIEFRYQAEGLARCYAFLTLPGSNQPYGIAVGTVIQDRVLVYLIRKKDEPCKLARYFRDHSGVITSLSISADGKFLASGSVDQTIKIWSLEGINTTETRFGPVAAWGASFLFDQGKVVARGVLEAGTAARKGIREGDIVVDARFIPGLNKHLGAEVDKALTDARSILRGLESSALWDPCILTLQRRGSRMNRQVLIVPAWSPVVTLYVDDQGEWAAFTPQGYFESSVAGDELFGWQINRSQAQKPDFFRADQFRKQLERPGAMKQLLVAGSMAQALRLVDEAPDEVDPVVKAAQSTPRITIISPTDNQELAENKVPLVARVEYPSDQERGEPTGSAFVNGVPGKLVNDRADGSTRTFEWSADVYDTYNRLRVVTADASTDPVAFADVHFRLRGKGEARRPRLHRFLLAASKYQHVPALEFPVKDAQSIADILAKKTGVFYDLGVTKELYNEAATKESVTQAIEAWKTELVDARSDDLLIVFVAGHGLAVDEKYYFVPVSTQGVEQVAQTGISWDLLAKLSEVGCKKLFLLDTCHSGNVLPLKDVQASNWKHAVRPLKQTEMMVVTATDAGQEALEVQSIGHGVFTQAILDGLEGAADQQKDQDVFLQEVTEWVEAEVPRRTKDLQLQTPRSYPVDLMNAVSVPIVSLR